MAHDILRNAKSFVRWRLVPVRHLGRLPRLSARTIRPLPKPTGETAWEVEKKGYATGPTIAKPQLEELQAMFQPREADIPDSARRGPFTNLARDEDLITENALTRFAFSPQVLDPALDYFGGRATLDSLQVLYSFPQQGKAELQDSQRWHLDYGDSRSYHCVAYLNDVLTDDDGPFVFVDKAVSKKVGRSMIIRRIEDDQMTTETAGAPLQKIYGQAGSSILIDPAACYHYGSRCVTPRFAVFVTFNSDAPFNGPQSPITRNAKKIAELAKSLRPDLDPAVIDRMLYL